MINRLRRARQRRRRDESGFTLAELILSIAIETIIFGALATAFVVVLNSGNTVSENLNKSADARFAANYIVSDARNSSGPETSLTDTTSCPDPSPPVAGPQTPVARFNWNAPNAAGTTTANITNYLVVGTSLLRRHCEAGVLVSDASLASDVTSATVTCAPIANCSGNPVSITVAIIETADKAGGAPFTYSLTAAFRKLVSTGASLVPTPPQSLVIFGAGGCGIDVSGGSTIGVKVYGQASINTANSAGCNAINLSGSGIFTAGSTSILQGGTCVASGGSVCPTWTNYSPAKGDPYAGLATPPAQTTRTNACNGTFGSATALAGTYTTPFVVQGSVHCTLGSGIYIFQAGFSVTAGATLDTAAGGVLLYVTGGAFNVDGAGVVQLAAMTTGTYAGLVVWQKASDTTTFTIGGSGAVTFSGAIYIPTAEVLLNGDGQATKITSVVTQYLVMQGSAGIIIGASAVPLAISAPADLPDWTINRPYPATTLSATGGDGSYTWSATGLPNGLALNASTGIVSGTPTVAGSPTVTVTLNDALGDDPDTQTFTPTINAVPTISTTSLVTGEKTLAYSSPLAGATGTSPYVWTQSGLPSGFSINPATGTISNSAAAVAATTSVTVTLTDAAGAAVSKVLSLVVNPSRIISVAITDGPGTAGTIDAGDVVTIVYSPQMKVSTFCSAWTNDAADQNLNALSDVTVAVSNAAADTLTATSLACPTFNFGSIALGSASYVSVAATFKGSTTLTRSTIAWTTATHTLVITLGAKVTGTVANVATSVVTYTTASGLRDAGNTALNNSPFVVATARRF